jgi:hypothetical protein
VYDQLVDRKGFSYSLPQIDTIFFPLPCFLPNPKPRQSLPIKVLKVLVNKYIEEISVFHGPWAAQGPSNHNYLGPPLYMAVITTDKKIKARKQ